MSSVLEPKQARSVATRHRLLTAAVEELLAVGYDRVTTVAVAGRAGMTRGAMQHHFPDRERLIAEAVRHLCTQRAEALQAQIAALPRDEGRVRAALDLVFAEFRGQVFTLVVQLSLHAQHEPALRPVIEAVERMLTRVVHDLAAAVAPDRHEPWTLTMAAIRGLSVLEALGHPATVVDAQWRYARQHLEELLTR